MGDGRRVGEGEGVMGKGGRGDVIRKRGREKG